MDKETFLEIIKNSKSWKLVVHNNPDPDAIAAAFGFLHILNFFKKRGKIFYSGIIGRAENREFVKRLKIPLNEINGNVFKKNSNIALFDCQPANQNHPLPKGIIPKIVIDHHPLQKKNPKILYKDIRPNYGSTSSIIIEYLKELEIPIIEKIATALYYGIKTDSQNFIRDISEKDFKAIEYIMPYVSLKKIGKIENPPVSKEYLKILCYSLQNIEIIEKALISDAGKVPYPDVTAQIADLVIRLRDVNYALIFSYFDNSLYFSIRTKSRKKIAGKLATTIVKGLGSGGGHENSAGGTIKVEDYDEYERIKNLVKERYLKKVVKGYKSLKN